MSNDMNVNADVPFSNLVDFGMRVRQSDFGALVGISQQAVSAFMNAGVLIDGATAGEWLLAYCSRLRGEAAGRMGNGDLDLVQERAGLAKAQRESQEIKNAVAKREYAPVALLSEILASASQSIADQLNALPGELKKVAPEMPESARDTIDNTCRTARNNWVMATLNLEVNEVTDDENEEDE